MGLSKIMPQGMLTIRFRKDKSSDKRRVRSVSAIATLLLVVLGLAGCPASTPPPPAPTDLTVSYANGMITLNWQLASEGVFYRVYRNGTLIATNIAANDTTYVDSTYTTANPTDNGEYIYTVRAVNFGGESSDSVPVRIIPVADDTPPAEAVTIGGLTASDTSISFMLANPNSEEVRVAITLTPAAPADTMIEFDGAVVVFTAEVRIPLAASGDADATKAIRITGLASSTEYTVTVTTFDTSGNAHNTMTSDSITTATPAPPGAPAPPEDLVFTIGDGEVALTWNSVDGADSYNIYRDGMPITTTPDPLTATTYTDTGLTNGATYTYTVSAVNASGESNVSDPAFVTLLPDPPAGLRAVGEHERVALTWESATGATEYRIYRDGMRVTTIPDPLTATTYTDTGRTNGIEYIYTVRAVNLAGESGDSDMVPATPTLTLPDPPADLRAVGEHERVALIWNSVDGADSYNIYRDGMPITTTPDPLTATTYTDTGLTNGVEYIYTVRAMNLAGEGGHSNMAPATPTLTLPDPPANLRAAGGDRTVALIWESVDGADSYNIYRDGMPITTTPDPLTATTYTDTGLTNGVEYIYTVRAMNLAGESRHSNMAPATPLRNLPDPPADLRAVGGDRTVALIWESVDGADSYNIYRDGTPITTTPDPLTATAYTDTGLTNGVEYIYTVRAVNPIGEGGHSNMAPATPLPPRPDPPADLRAVGENGRVALTWNDVTGATGYRIYRDGTPVATLFFTTTYIDTGRTNGVEYIYIVRAVNLGGESGDSNMAPATPRLTPPNPPANLRAIAGDGTVALTWESVNGATEYHINRDGTRRTITPDPFIATTYTDTGLTNGVKYIYTVQAANLAGESRNSNTAPATPLPPPPAPPADLRAVGEIGRIILTWDGVGDATEYRIYRDGTRHATTPATTYTDTGLLNGAAHTYTVRAVNTGVESVDSKMASAATLLPTGNFNTLLVAGNRTPRGIWSDGTTMWVVDNDNSKIFAYNMHTKTRDIAKEFDTLSLVGNLSPQGIWSDGTTMWVVDNFDIKIYAYNMETRVHDASNDFNDIIFAGNTNPRGIWSDGTTMWVTDNPVGDGKIFAYDLKTKERDSDKDFNGLAAFGNTVPQGIWANDTTMWVANNPAGDGKIFAYDLKTKARAASNDFDTLAATLNRTPWGIWSNGTTMWVVDSMRARILAYNLATKNYAP